MSDQDDYYKKDNRDVEADELERLTHDTKIIDSNMRNEKEKLDQVLNNGVYKEINEKDTDETEKKVEDDIDRILRTMPLTDDTTCGFWILRGKFFQRFANKKAYVILYGVVGCIFSMTYAYFNGTITTIEKRYKIPSKNTGIITVGNDISQLFASAALSYYAGRGHRPRWIGFGLLTIVMFCFLTALPHLLYGPGEDALRLTTEYGASVDLNTTLELSKKALCNLRGSGPGIQCEETEGNFAPQVVLFLAQFISGIGGSLYYTLGVSYMDDNTKKSKTPALLSLSYFMRMLGPAIGYALASFCLRMYISPMLTPTITNSDPRWLGAWWLGWIILGILLCVSGLFLTMFPKTLPRAAARKILEKERQKKSDKMIEEEEPELPASFKDMMKTFKKLTTNATLMCNNLAAVFYFFGYMPYWIFTAKYIEIQYRQSAATSSLVTGTVALAFSAVGILLSGFVISKYKPRARYMAAWNVAVGAFSVIGMISYAFLGCPMNEKSMVINIPDSTSLTPTCNSVCQCDYVKYSPVCGEDGNTYISPCHAGCKEQIVTPDGRKVFYDCSCIPGANSTVPSKLFQRWEGVTSQEYKNDTFESFESVYDGGQAIPGPCPVDCFKQFVMFLSVMCFLKFIGATGRASNFLVSVRCVPEKDKTAAMGFGLMLMSLFAFMPSPVFFGWVLDKLCLVWGKTCSSKGNCWLYDAESLRYILNFIASVFVSIGTLFDVGVWYYVKDLKIFDEEIKETELQEFDREEEATVEKKAEM